MKGIKMRDGIIFYSVNCNKCGRESFIQKSFGMVMGFLNIGHADCDGCGNTIKVKFNDELQQMDVLEDEKC